MASSAQKRSRGAQGRGGGCSSDEQKRQDLLCRALDMLEAHGISRESVAAAAMDDERVTQTYQFSGPEAAGGHGHGARRPIVGGDERVEALAAGCGALALGGESSTADGAGGGGEESTCQQLTKLISQRADGGGRAGGEAGGAGGGGATASEGRMEREGTMERDNGAAVPKRQRHALPSASSDVVGALSPAAAMGKLTTAGEPPLPRAALFCACDAAGNITEWGLRGAALTGLYPSDVLGRPLLEILTEPARVGARVADVLAEVAAAGGDVTDAYLFSFRRRQSGTAEVAERKDDRDDRDDDERKAEAGSGGGGALNIVLEIHAITDQPQAPAAPSFAFPSDAANNGAAGGTGEGTEEGTGRGEGGGIGGGGMTRGPPPQPPPRTREGGTKLFVGGTEVFGVGQDVTQELAQLQDLRRLLATANAPIIGIDQNNCVNEWNQKAVALTGFSRDEAMGERLVDQFIEPQAQASVQEVLDDALQGRPQENYQFVLMTSARQPLQVSVSV